MGENTPRIARLHRDGTVSVFLTAEEAAYYDGPGEGGDAIFRCQVVSVDDLEAERAGRAPTLPWLRRIDRRRAVADLHRMGADRALLEHVASAPVAGFSPSPWSVITVVRGRRETDEPFRSDLICSTGGAVFDAALPYSLRGDGLQAYLRSIPRDDPRRRERVAVALGQHDEGLPPTDSL